MAVSAATTEYRDKIVTEVQDGVLKISTTDHGKWWKSVRNKKMKAYVSFKTLTRLEAHGASDVFLNSDLKADELSVVLSGASDLKGQKGKIEVRALDLTLSGASDAVIHGTVITLTVEASGASDLKGYDLQTDHCNANASGASDIKITVNKDLSAKASGASGVHYKGEGVIRDLRTSGASNISRKG